MRAFQGPNVLCLTRASAPPIPGQRDESGQKKAPDVDASGAQGTKRELVGISDKSKKNLAALLSSLDWTFHGDCWHVTLTYHLEFPRGKPELAKAKNAIVNALSRHFECGLWRLEFQTRLAPHWHCLLWLGRRDPEQVECWLRSWWADYSGNASVQGVYISAGHEGRAAWYLAMHAAKDEQAPPFKVGRWWGYIARDNLLKAQELHESFQVDPHALRHWKRLFRRYTRAAATRRRVQARSFRTFCRAFGYRIPRSFGGDLLGWSAACEAAGRFVTAPAVKPYRNADQGMSWFLPRAAQWRVYSWVNDEIERRRSESQRDPF